MKADRIPMEQVMAAAAQDELGALLESLPFNDANSFRRKAGRRVHRFEHGLVAPSKDVPLTLPYRTLRIYREEVHHLQQNGRIVDYIDVNWVFQREDGEVWKTMLQRRLRDADDPLIGMYEQALATTCAEQREEVLRRLADGATLSFGPVDIELTHIRSGAKSAPWSSVLSIGVVAGALAVRAKPEVEHRWIKEIDIGAPLSRIPNFPLLWQLMQLIHHQALIHRQAST